MTAGSPAPLPTATGTLVSNNPALITGLQPGTQYIFYVRAICPTSGTSAWSSGKNFLTLVINDDCSGALFAPVNSSSVCQQIITGTIAGATASIPGINAPCVGTSDDDVWFQFIATNTYLNISLQNVTGSTTNLNYAVYSGQCGTLTQVFCSPANALSNVANNLVVGQTYFIRVYSFANTPQTSTFDLCITTPSTCSNSNTICNLFGENTPSTLGVSSLGTIGCLLSSPDPTFYTLEVATTGPINLFLSQNALPNGQGAGRDIDYAAWGPFTSQAQACSVVGNQAPFAPPGIGVPVTQTTGCSFSAASTETLNIANALAGQIYIILITNYSQQSGFINLTQTNFGQPGAGTVSCCPEAFFKYLPASYCKASGAPNPVAVITVGSLSGVFSSPYTPGLVFANTATGEIDLAASAPGNYVIVNTLLASGTCQQKVRTYTINISEPTSAIINYGSPSYCKSVTALQAVSQTGTPGGSYSAIPNIGLSINPTTGDINPSLSSPGVYTVIYGLPGSICTTGNPSTQVEIIALPNIVQPAPVVVCDSYSLQPITVGNYYSQSNGVGTPLDINVPLISSQLVYIYAVNSNGCSNEKSFSVTINSVPTPTYTPTASSCSSATGTITVNTPVSATGTTPDNIIIYKVTDAGSQAPLAYRSLTYIGLYNGTGSTVNLANYKLKVYNNGISTLPANNNLALSGSMPNNSTKIIAIGSANNPATGVVPSLTFATCSGVNNNDNIRLTTSTDVVVDNWGTTDGSIFTPSGQVGYTYTRNPDATPLPSVTWNPADWTVVLPEDYSNINSYSLAVSNYQYSLDNGAFQSGTFFNNLAVGNHILIVKDLTTGCLSAPVTITIAPLNPITAVTTFDYQPTAVVCQNATTNPIPNTSATGFTFGGTFSEDTNLSTGLVFVSTLTGEIDLANSTPGIHTVIYKVIDQPSSCLTGTQSSATIEIKPIITPVIGFSYPVSICKNALPTLLAPLAPGLSSFAMFSVTPPTGLAINSTTGVIDLANSTAGMYDIVVTVAADSNTCRVSATTAPAVSLEIKPVVTLETGFGYNAPLCANNGTELPNPNPGFATGGTYTSTPPGLIINSSTGAIDLTSTPGPYTVTYMVNPVVSNCEVSTPGTTQVTIVPPVSIELTGGCQSVKYVLTATPVNGSFVPETATFAWHNAPGVNVGSTQSIEVPATGIYTVTVTVAGCDTVSAPFTVDSIICVIQKGISVNNDGLNDTFDLRGFNVKKLTLFNRYGMKVYSLENYTNEWGGKSDKGDELPDGTYYYIIDRNNGETKTGWIYINRAQ